MNTEFGKTSAWKVPDVSKETNEAHQIISSVYLALKTKGYDPVIQLSGFLTTGDPTYITSYNQARSMICRLDREEIVEELIKIYFNKIDEELIRG